MKHEGRRATRGSQTGSRLARLRQRAQGHVSEQAGRLADEAATRHQQMMSEAVGEQRGTRRRALLPAAIGFALLAGMFQLVSSNVLAVNFTTGDNKFKIYSNYLDAQKAAGFLSPTKRRATASDCNTTEAGVQAQCGVAELGIKTARLAGLCAITSETLPAPLSNVWSLKITAGLDVPNTAVFHPATFASGDYGVNVNSTGQLTNTGADVVEATNLFINTDLLTGYGNLISGLNLGQSAETVAASATLDGDAWPAGQQAPTAGNFGLYANQLNVAGINGDTYGINLAGNIKLPKLKIAVEYGAKNQDDCS